MKSTKNIVIRLTLDRSENISDKKWKKARKRALRRISTNGRLNFNTTLNELSELGWTIEHPEIPEA